MTRVCLLLILFFLPGGLCAAESPEWLRRAGIIPAAKSKEPKIFSGCFCLKRCILRSIEWYKSRPRRPKLPSSYLYPEREEPEWRRLQREYREEMNKEEKKIKKKMKELDKQHQKMMTKLEDKGEWGKKLRKKMEEDWEKLNKEIDESEKKLRKERKEFWKKFNKSKSQKIS